MLRAVPGVEYEREAARYQQGRVMPLAAIAPWRDALAPWLGGDAPRRRLLDVGAGTGQFAHAFPGWFGCAVIALEPAAAMRREGRRGATTDEPAGAVAWLGGRAAELPLAAGSCDAAWLSTVLHHVGDLGTCARELRRVLVDGAPVLIRSAFPERADDITLLRYFPEARRRLDAFPSVARVGAAFARAGFALRETTEVPQVSAADLVDFRARVVTGRHADSLLTTLDDAAFSAGLARLDAAVAADRDRAPVHDRLTLIVLR